MSSLHEAPRRDRMVFDSVGLGYVVRDGAVYVSYPVRLPGGQTAYGGGFPLGAIPDVYWSDPPNAITAERVALWRSLLA